MCCSITGLAALWAARPAGALALPIGEIMSITRDVMFSLPRMSRSELQALGGVQWRQVLEQDLVLGGFGRLEVDLV